MLSLNDWLTILENRVSPDNINLDLERVKLVSSRHELADFNAKVIKLEQVKASKKDKNIFTFFKDRKELNLQIDKLTNSISVYKDKKDELSKNEIQIKNMYSLKEEVLKLNHQIDYYKDELAKTKQRKIDIEERKKQREINNELNANNIK